MDQTWWQRTFNWLGGQTAQKLAVLWSFLSGPIGIVGLALAIISLAITCAGRPDVQPLLYRSTEYHFSPVTPLPETELQSIPTVKPRTIQVGESPAPAYTPIPTQTPFIEATPASTPISRELDPEIRTRLSWKLNNASSDSDYLALADEAIHYRDYGTAIASAYAVSDELKPTRLQLFRRIALCAAGDGERRTARQAARHIADEDLKQRVSGEIVAIESGEPVPVTCVLSLPNS